MDNTAGRMWTAKDAGFTELRMELYNMAGDLHAHGEALDEAGVVAIAARLTALGESLAEIEQEYRRVRGAYIKHRLHPKQGAA